MIRYDLTLTLSVEDTVDTPAAAEVARQLTQLAEKVRYAGLGSPIVPRDVNGNRVGELTVVETAVNGEDELTVDVELGEPFNVDESGHMSPASDSDALYVASTAPVDTLGDELDGTCRGFSNVSSRFTGQQDSPNCLDGAEYVGSGMLTAIRSTPGTWLLVAADRDEDDLAWLALHRPLDAVEKGVEA